MSPTKKAGEAPDKNTTDGVTKEIEDQIMRLIKDASKPLVDQPFNKPLDLSVEIDRLSEFLTAHGFDASAPPPKFGV